ncbi:hypothetical protein IF2G_06595 [Cordyceps javanica]|nr:hypothetical protein IF2G_06595 [Cordyceps javanica]
MNKGPDSSFVHLLLSFTFTKVYPSEYLAWLTWPSRFLPNKRRLAAKPRSTRYQPASTWQLVTLPNFMCLTNSRHYSGPPSSRSITQYAVSYQHLSA